MSKPRRQCAKCPWKKGVNPNEIPNGYSRERHLNLRNTIAEPGALDKVFDTMRVFACHETGGDMPELPCVGWLVHQLSEGNNIPLRFAVATGRIDANVRTVGPQHRTFEDTLPAEDP